jgi:TolA-binding protein
VFQVVTNTLREINLSVVINKVRTYILLLLGVCLAAAVNARTMPDELYQGMIQYELDSGRYFDALVLMDDQYKKSHPIQYLSALQGFNISHDLPELIEKAKSGKKPSDLDYFLLGKSEYLRDDCLAALKLFKNIQNNLPLESKEPLTFYRANCFIRLGSNVRAAQALTGMVGGIWVAYAYYNLAVSYAETSRDKTKALVALRVAESLNTGSTKEAKALNDRINLVAGKLYLESDKKDSAIQFFKKVYLNSESTAPALYLNGLAQLELGDFRAATQAWHSLKSYPLINQSVSEALLAIPYAFERSGYISQTIEAYLEASNTFEAELEKIGKIDDLLTKHGAVNIFIDDSEIEGLEWFLAKDVVKNTTRAVYYQYLMQDYNFYDQVRLYEELSFLSTGLDYWNTQLDVFEKSLRAKLSTFRNKSATFDSPGVLREINRYKSQIDTLVKQEGMTTTLSANLDVNAMKSSIEDLKERLVNLQSKMQKGEKSLNSQLDDVKLLARDILSIKRGLNKVISSLSTEITNAARNRLATLRKVMVSNFERSEQGLIHIFEDMAESKQMKRRNLLDGRYQ